MIKKIFLISSIFMFLWMKIQSTEIPDYLHICHRKDPELTTCLKESIETLRPKLATGLEEIDVVGIDPFHMDNITIFEGAGGTHAYLENVECRGASKFEITNLKLDVDKMIYRIGIAIPHLDIDGHYNVNIRLLTDGLTGEGNFQANVSNVDCQAVVQGALKENHLIFQSVVLKINVKDFNVDLGELFEKDTMLSRTAKELITIGKNDMLKTALPFIEKKAATIVLDMCNKISKNLDYDEVFPE